MRFSELGYISNLLSLSRVFLAIPIYYFLSSQTPTGNYLAVFLMLLAALTDAFDGMLARRLKQKSDLGRFLDPIADKVCMAVIAIVLVKTRGMPVWFLIVLISRDLAILLIGLFLALRTNHVVESNMLGKITVNALALTVIAYTLEWEKIKIVFMWITLAFLLASSFSYTMKLIRGEPVTRRPV